MTSETGSRRPAELRAPSPSASAPREDDPPWRRQAIPRLRSGSYLPSFLEPRSRSEQALVAVVQEAYVNGVSTRKVDRLVTQLGLTGISRSRVSRLCSGLDEQVRLFRERPLEGAYPYLSLDAKVEKVREAGGVRSRALVVAYRVHESGRREVIGIDVGESETEASGGSYCAACGRAAWGVALCVSDAHQGLKAAVGKVLGCTWQRCTVHFLREMLGHVSRAQQPIMATAIRRIFAAESSTEASECLGGVVAALRGPPPKVARLLEEAAEELLAFMSFPVEH